MSLDIYKNADPSTIFSSDSTFSNALSITVDGVIGSIIQRKYYVRNDNILRFYTNVKVKPKVLSGLDIITGANQNFIWKLNAGDAQPLEDQWTLVSAANTISLSDLGQSGSGDITTFLPFWLRIEVPRATPITSYQNIGLQTIADENIV